MNQLLLTCGAALSFISVATAQLSITSVGIYDENVVRTNAVDVSATSTSGNQISFSDFSTLVANAYTNNHGGVLNFDALTVGVNEGSIVASYGALADKTLTITSGQSTWAASNNATNRTPISGNQYLSVAGVPDGGNFIFNFSVSDQVVAVGATLLSRSGSSDGSFKAQVTFSDDTTTSVTLTSLGSSNGGNDTFAGFNSPGGLFIKQFSFENDPITSNRYRGLDDLGFVTIPEPSTYAVLLGVAALGLVSYRRRC